MLVFAALAVATKDQAYALFLLGIPLALGAWLALDREARPLAARLAKELAIGAAIAVPLLLFIDGAVTNPGGWRDRVQYLLGSASQDFAYYPRTWAGRFDAAWHGLLPFDQFYPLGLRGARRRVGIGLACATPDRAQARRGPRPALRGPLVHGRLQHERAPVRAPVRPPADAHVRASTRASRSTRRTRASGSGGARSSSPLVVPCLAYALFQCVAVDAAMVLDPKYDAERWIREHVRSRPIASRSTAATCSCRACPPTGPSSAST